MTLKMLCLAALTACFLQDGTADAVAAPASAASQTAAPASPGQWTYAKNYDAANSVFFASLMTPIGPGRYFYAYCSAVQHLMGVLIADDTGSTPVASDRRFNIRVSGGQDWTETAHVYRHSPDYLGVKIDLAGKIEAILEDIAMQGGGRAIVEYADPATGQFEPVALDPTGGTAAIEAYLLGCYGKDGLTPTQRQPVAVLQTDAWIVSTRTNTIYGGRIVGINSSAADGTRFGLSCDRRRDPTGVFLPGDASMFPGPRPSVYTAILSVGDQIVSDDFGLLNPDTPTGTPALIIFDGKAAWTVAELLQHDGEIGLTVIGSNGDDAYYELPREGAAEAAERFVLMCRTNPTS